MAQATFNTLYDYYGGKMPSLQERGTIYEKAGLGTAADYVTKNRAGDAAPNTALLKYLQGGDANVTIGEKQGISNPNSLIMEGGVGSGAGGGGGKSWPDTNPTGSGADIYDTVKTLVDGAGQFPDYQRDPKVDSLIKSLEDSGADIGSLIDRATNELGSISSSQSEVDRYIADAIESQNKFKEENAKAAESKFSREYDYTLNKLEGERTAALEGGRGNAQQYYAMQLMDRDIEKSLRDLESRKVEAIASGNAKAYEVISGLQLKQLEMRQNARQKYFENVMSVAGLAGKQAEIYGNILSNIQKIDSDKLNYQIQSYRAKLDSAATLGDALVEQAKIKIAERELDIREAEAGADGQLQAPPGWANFNMFNSATSTYLETFTNVAQGLQDGSLDSEQAFAQIAATVKRLYMSAGPNVTKDAFERAMGVKIDDAGNLISAEMTPGVSLSKDGMSDASDKNAPWAAMMTGMIVPGTFTGPTGEGAYGSFVDLMTGKLIIDEDGNLRTPDGKPVVEKKNN